MGLRTNDFNREPVQTPGPTAPAPEWSDNQKRIFNFVATGRGSAVVIAVAGSGKTTTIVEAAYRLPSHAGFSAAFVAFNKSIAEELKSRLPQTVKAQTLNSMGFGAWRRYLGDDAAHLQLDANKTRTLVKDIVPDQHFNLCSKGMARVIGLAKALGVVPETLEEQYEGLVPDSDDLWIDIIERFGVDTEADMDRPAEAALFIDYARRILHRSITFATKLIDFDDQLYMPIITGARFWQNDFIFVDEAQDLNRIQRVMLRRALKPTTGRLVAVGDPYQAIYGFRGADHTSIEAIQSEFNAVELPLTISYRCPRAVVDEVHQWVDHIQSAPNAPLGSVQTLSKFTSTTFAATDVIICRNTRPLIELAFAILRDGVACKVKGRDIGAGLVALIKKFKTNDLDTLLDKLNSHVTTKSAKYIADGKEDMAQRLQDQFDTIVIFAEQVMTGTVADLIAKIESLFTDNGPAILTLSTIHKAKGLEWKQVFVLDPDLMPSKYARTPAAKAQERNLQYVAGTRTKDALTYIHSNRFVPKSETKGAGTDQPAPPPTQ